MAKKVSQSPVDETTRLCFVLCKARQPGDVSQASRVAAEILGKGHRVEMEKESIWVVRNGKKTVGIMAHMPVPVPMGEAENNAEDNAFWPGGKAKAAKHRSHVAVISNGTEAAGLAPVASAMHVTRLALVALKLFDGMGVYWGNGSITNSRAVFEDFCANMTEDDLPMPLWLRFQPVRKATNELGLYTVGMQQFRLMDLEVDRCKMDFEQLFSFISDIAHYLLQKGPVIEDGHTVGTSEEKRVRVRIQPSMVDTKRQVYKFIIED